MRPLGLGHDPAPAAPALARGPQEVLEAAGGPAGEGALCSGLLQFSSDVPGQPDITGQAEQVLDGVLLAPVHQFLTGEAGIGAQHDAQLGPALAQLAHDARDLLNRAGGGGDVGGPQLGAQQVIAAEDVERQVAVIAVIAMEEAAPPDCRAGDRRWRPDRARSLRAGPRARQGTSHEQRLDRRRIVADFVIARRLRPRISCDAAP